MMYTQIVCEQEELIERMVRNFLQWRLPSDFTPDAGVTFNASENPNLWPVGTNLLTGPQAREMVEFMIFNNPDTWQEKE